MIETIELNEEMWFPLLCEALGHKKENCLLIHVGFKEECNTLMMNVEIKERVK